jgi:acyl-CoA-binding protein
MKMLSAEETSADIDARFANTSAGIKRIGHILADGDMSELYGLYKQATCGDCGIPSPAFYKVKESLKWNAWDGKRGLLPEDAKTRYIEYADQILYSIASYGE